MEADVKHLTPSTKLTQVCYRCEGTGKQCEPVFVVTTIEGRTIGGTAFPERPCRACKGQGRIPFGG